MWWWVGAWLLLLLGGAASLFLVGRVAWRRFAELVHASADAAETASELSTRFSDAVETAEAAAETAAAINLADPVEARARVVELREQRATRRNTRLEKHLAHGADWHVDNWLADRQNHLIAAAVVPEEPTGVITTGIVAE